VVDRLSRVGFQAEILHKEPSLTAQLTGRLCRTLPDPSAAIDTVNKIVKKVHQFTTPFKEDTKATGNSRTGIPGGLGIFRNRGPAKFPAGIPGNF